MTNVAFAWFALVFAFAMQKLTSMTIRKTTEGFTDDQLKDLPREVIDKHTDIIPMYVENLQLGTVALVYGEPDKIIMNLRKAGIVCYVEDDWIYFTALTGHKCRVKEAEI